MSKDLVIFDECSSILPKFVVSRRQWAVFEAAANDKGYSTVGAMVGAEKVLPFIPEAPHRDLPSVPRSGTILFGKFVEGL